MLERRPDGQLAPVEVHVDDPPARREARREAAEHRGAAREVVEGVHDEDHLAAARGQAAARPAGEDRAHVVDAGLPRAPAEDLEHARLDVDGVDDARRPHGAGHAERQVAGAGADVAGDVAGAEPEGGDDPIRLLPGGAVGPLEAR